MRRTPGGSIGGGGVPRDRSWHDCLQLHFSMEKDRGGRGVMLMSSRPTSCCVIRRFLWCGVVVNRGMLLII